MKPMCPTRACLPRPIWYVFSPRDADSAAPAARTAYSGRDLQRQSPGKRAGKNDAVLRISHNPNSYRIISFERPHNGGPADPRAAGKRKRPRRSVRYLYSAFYTVLHLNRARRKSNCPIFIVSQSNRKIKCVFTGSVHTDQTAATKRNGRIFKARTPSVP